MAEYRTQQKALLLDFLSRNAEKTYSMESLADALSELSDTFAYKEFVQLIDQVFKK